MEKLKILVLYYQNDTEPADVVAAQVMDALKANGHSVAGAGIFREVSEIVAAVRRRKPDLVFNLCETFNEDPKLEANVAGVLELMAQPFTGAGMVGLTTSAISHQLRLLRGQRLVKYHKEGKLAFYSLDDEHIEHLFAEGLRHVGTG